MIPPKVLVTLMLSEASWRRLDAFMRLAFQGGEIAERAHDAYERTSAAELRAWNVVIATEQARAVRAATRRSPT
jgi:hypothetical protein